MFATRNRIRTFVNLTVPQYLILIIFTTGSAILVINPILSSDVLENFLKVILSLSFAVFGLNSLNQIFDIEIDRLSKPLRPLPAKEISVREVYIFSLLSFLLAFLASLTISLIFTILTLIFILLAVLYSLPPIRLKRYGLSSNLIGGTLYGAIPFLSSWAIAGDEFQFNFFVLFYGLAISIATLKDFEDAETEKKVGIKTLPILLGYRKARIVTLLMIFSLLSLMLISSLLMKNIFIYPTLFSFLVLYGIAKIDFHKHINVTSQSKNVTIGMIAIALIEFSYGITSLFVYLIAL